MNGMFSKGFLAALEMFRQSQMGILAMSVRAQIKDLKC